MEALDRTDPVSVGGYRLLARLGSGGMGRVYLGVATDGHRAAVKVIREDFESAEALARFRREAATVGTVRGPFTAALVASGLDETPYWLATEYVAGPTVAEAVRRNGPLKPETCLRLIAALAQALLDVHGQGVQHRDLKPQNIILSLDRPRLIDFGIAKGEDQTAITRTGTAPGTPGYLAPEVITQQSMSPAADIFALAGVMAFAATGRAPFGVGDPHAVLYRTVHGEIDVEGVEPRLAELIRWCAAKEPEARPTPSALFERCGRQEPPAGDSAYQAMVAAHTERLRADAPTEVHSLVGGAVAGTALEPVDRGDTIRVAAPADPTQEGPDGQADRLVHAAPPAAEAKGRRKWLAIGAAIAVPALVGAQLAFDLLPIGQKLVQLKHPLVLQQVATIEREPCKPKTVPDIDGNCYTFDNNMSRPLVLRQVTDISVEFPPPESTARSPFVLLTLTPGDAAGLAEITEQAAKVPEGSPGRQVAIRLDNGNEVLSAPVVVEKITGGRFQITGGFTQESAEKLMKELTDGS